MVNGYILFLNVCEVGEGGCATPAQFGLVSHSEGLLGPNQYVVTPKPC